MRVPVMNIRAVRVRVLDRLVAMLVGMLALGVRESIMRVAVVRVVSVAVCVHQSRVAMNVRVTLARKEPGGCRHQR